MKNMILTAIVVLISFFGSTHDKPHSVLLLDVRKDGIKAELSLPLKEFQTVYPNLDLDFGPKIVVQSGNDWLDTFVSKHLILTDSEGRSWKIRINGKNISETQQVYTGKYHELKYDLWFQPPAGSSVRNFILNYDLIMHQLSTHKLVLKVSSDWYGGLSGKDTAEANLGIVTVNPETGKSMPLEINLERKASCWKGFTVFVGLGMEQIKSGTNHLLFLVVLMLSAAFSARNGRWKPASGVKESLFRAAKVAGLFTIGHSIALCVAAMHWFTVPQLFIEIAVYATVLLVAVHTIRPVFHGYEGILVVVFGLIHGFAFSVSLTGLQLDGERLVYSLLGLNAGVELMQLFVVLCTVPWLILISNYPLHKILRVSGALFAVAASVSWILARTTGNSNMISDVADIILSNGKWMIAGLALLGILTEIYQQVRSKKASSGITG